MEDWEDFAVDSVVQGHHIHKSIWPHFWEKFCEQKWRREMKKTDTLLPFSKMLPFSKTVALSLAMSLAASPEHSTSF